MEEMEEEVLLSLNREFTDKEKYEWCNVQLIKSRQMLKAKSKENEKLKAQLKELQDKIQRERIQLPSQIIGVKHISHQAYGKLWNRLKELEKLYIEEKAKKMRLARKLHGDKPDL